MKIGAVYPQIELAGAPEAVQSIGTSVEAMGLDHLVMYDHVLGAVHAGREPALTGPYTERDPFHDPFVAFGYLAGITKRLEFVTGVLILPQRQTVLVAKQAADLDLFSSGRFTMGVGIGWNHVEYDALGQEFGTRGKRIDEQIPYLRRLWSEDVIEWEGRFDRIDRANLIPKPRRAIPILVGGVSEAAFKRGAKLGDGFLFAEHGRAIAREWPRIKELLVEEGRPVDGFIAHSFIMSERLSGLGPQDAADGVRRWQDAGGTHASIVSMGQSLRNAQEHIDYFEAVRAQV